jgi:hypothetical protein
MVLRGDTRDPDSETYYNIACAIIVPASYYDGIAKTITNSRRLDHELHQLLLCG